jgi:hypothetical protein
MKAFVSLCVIIAVVFAGCGGGPDGFESVDDIAAALSDEGIDCEIETSSPGRLVADYGTCGALDLFVFDSEGDRDRWLNVGADLGEVVVGPNWTVLADSEGDAREIADALGGDIR